MLPENLDKIISVIDAPVYQTFCNDLFQIFCRSRNHVDPTELIAIQEELCAFISVIQERKREFRAQNDQIRSMIADRLILLSKQIMDSVAWRILNFDRILVQQLADHHPTGHLDETTFLDVENAKQIVEDENAIVIVNDLTNILRYGDLTILSNGKFDIEETKYGKATKKNSRAIRQRKRLEELLTFINTGVRVNREGTTFAFKADIPINTYHETLSEAINSARNAGYHQAQLSDVVSISLISTQHSGTEIHLSDPFPETEYVWTMSNLDNFMNPTPRIVPYGVFPLDDATCFELISGQLIIFTTINFAGLKNSYSRVGLKFDFPTPPKQEMQAFLSLPIAEQKKHNPKFRFTINDGELEFAATPDYYGRVTLELMSEQTLIDADRQLANLVRDLDLTIPKRTRFYLGYTQEAEIWR